MNVPISHGRGNDSHREPSSPVVCPVMERLEDRLLLSVAAVEFVLDGPLGSPAPVEAPGLAEVQKLIVVGDPDGSPSDSPANHVDPNTTDSPYAGVGSVRVDATDFDGYVYLGSGSVISSTHVLTAAHMFDLDNNGTIDVDPLDVTFNLNFGGDVTHEITADALHVHPDFTGFANLYVNDDVAVVELSSPVPAGVPIYSLDTDPFEFIKTATLVGYGLSGDGVNGYDYGLGASWSVKRVGFNHTDVFVSDDEGSGSREVWEFDFDGPDGSTNLFGYPWDPYHLTLGNDVETTLGGGDSGGPSFIDDGSGNLEIFGINTFSFSVLGGPPAPLFGSGAGGIVVSAYTEWIQSVVDGVPAETLAITKATYNSRKAELKVEATSSLGGDGDTDLEATFFVDGVEWAPRPMTYNPRKGKWSVTFTSADGLGGVKPEKVRVYSTLTGAWVEKTDIGGGKGNNKGGKGPKSIPVATGLAIHAANTTGEGIADSPVLLPWARSTPVSAAARQPADVSIPLTVADLPPLAVDFATTGSQQSPQPQLVNQVLGHHFDDYRADSALLGELGLDLDVSSLDGNLLD